MTDVSTTHLPPIGNTGVEPTVTSVGWLAASIRPEDQPPDPFGLARLCSEHAPGGQAFGRALKWYGRSIRHDAGLWVVGYEGVGSARGTLSVTVSQDGCDAAPGLVLALLRLGMRASRLDLAGDVHDALARPRSYFDRRTQARTRTNLARWTYLEAGDGRSTVTIGARSSDRYARIYDKGDGRVRHEVELKGELAAGVAGRLLAGEAVADLWRDQYGRLVQWH